MSKCGRPLGFVFDKTKTHMYVADAFYGIFKVNVNTRSSERLVAPDVPYGNENPRKLKIVNSIALHSSGDLYFTDSSSDFDLENGFLAFLTNPSGRYEYNFFFTFHSTQHIYIYHV